jgi:transcriptional regulator GlxA family with amidase domain
MSHAEKVLSSGIMRSPLTVTLLALPETTPMTIYGLMETFASVGTAWAEFTGERLSPVRRIETRIVAASRTPIETGVRAAIWPHVALAEVGASDVVIITDLALTQGSDPRGRWAAETAWLRERYEAGAIVCSVCTGAVMLAEAGLLDGREATSHWGVVDLIARCYPAVQMRPERILCPAGPEHRVITAGGASAWADLALYLIARFSGEAEAVRIAKLFLFGDHNEGQLPFATLCPPRQHGDAAIAACQEWIARHYADPNPVAGMVRQSGLAERTFKRRFRAATGYSPVSYVQAIRIEEAKQILETTPMPTDQVARDVGYEDPAFFRRLFKRETGTTPARYRQRFQRLIAPV